MKICSNCKSENSKEAYRCKYCNTLFAKGRKVVANRKGLSKKIEDQKTVWNAAVSLYIIGALISLLGLFLSVFTFTQGGDWFGYLPIVIGLVFLGLGVWSTKEEFWSILIGFILFSIIYLLVNILAGFSFGFSLFFLPFEIYLIMALFQVKRKVRVDKRDLLDAN